MLGPKILSAGRPTRLLYYYEGSTVRVAAFARISIKLLRGLRGLRALSAVERSLAIPAESPCGRV